MYLCIYTYTNTTSTFWDYFSAAAITADRNSVSVLMHCFTYFEILRTHICESNDDRKKSTIVTSSPIPLTINTSGGLSEICAVLHFINLISSCMFWSFVSFSKFTNQSWARWWCSAMVKKCFPLDLTYYYTVNAIIIQ